MQLRRLIVNSPPRLAACCFLVVLFTAATAWSQSSPDSASRQAELLAKRPAKLKQPPLTVAQSAPAPARTSTSLSPDRLAQSPSPNYAGPPSGIDGPEPLPGRPSISIPGGAQRLGVSASDEYVTGDYNTADYVSSDPYDLCQPCAPGRRGGCCLLSRPLCGPRGGAGYDPSFDYGMPPVTTRFWGRLEYLFWSVEGMATPPLVTTSPAGTTQANAGILGAPGTQILFGGDRLNDQTRSGTRATIGGWFDSCQTIGLEAIFFGLGADRSDFSASATDTPILARPFFNVEPGFEGQDAELVAFPGLFAGRIDVSSRTTLAGGEILLRHKLAQDHCWRVDVLGGWRYARLHDELRISDRRTVVGGGIGLAIGTEFSEEDVFDAHNEFHGGELGFSAQHCSGPCWIEGTLKLAIGNTRSHVQISGESTATVPVPGALPETVSTSSGLLAQQTNIGSYMANEFAVMPELGVNVGYNVTPHLRAIVGYTFLYWTGVARAGDQIDPNLNLSQLAATGLIGVPRPQFRRITDDLWAQGVSVGIDGRF